MTTPHPHSPSNIARAVAKSHLLPHSHVLDKLTKPKTKSDIFSMPPYVYGMTYLALIPLFGAIYSMIPNMAFNHENVGFLEAMYFSTITVTTTGFGDVTPTNTFTRAFVMIEAVLGVVFIGLFLNSLNYTRQTHLDNLMESYELKKEISLAFARLRSHDSLITLNMNTYLNRVNQLLGIEAPQTPVATSDSEGKINLAQAATMRQPSTQNSATQSTKKSAQVPTELLGIHEPIPSEFLFADLQHLFQASKRLTDDPNKPQIWYYYQSLDDLIMSIENLLRETDLYRWGDLEALCVTYLSDIKSYDSSSYILAEPDFEKQLADIQAQREHDMGLISRQENPVYLTSENSLNPYIILYMGIETTIKFIQDFQRRYQAIMQSI